MGPAVKIIALSNVYTRMMHFIDKGDFENGHCHTFNHATLVSSGSVLYEVLDGPNGNTVASKKVKAPNLIFVDKDKYHRITALQKNTVCSCIHALRTIDQDIIDPDFLLEPLESNNKGEIRQAIKEKTGKDMLAVIPKWSENS
jgi:hypothetical protein